MTELEPGDTGESNAGRHRERAADGAEDVFDNHDALEGLRVLLVEDDEDTLQLIKAILERRGADVTAAASADEALASLERAKPDVLLSDIGMPGGNGYELIKKIRALGPEQGGRVPAVALTAYAGPKDRRRALLAGFQVHLAKPIEPDELLAVVASLGWRGGQNSA
jgi:CheY-like chemotaxis protein